MDFRKIEYFVKVAKCLNFSQAADEIHISHQGLSKQISILEKELGASLFERSTTKVVMTEAGKKMYEEFQPIVIAANRSYEKIEDFIKYKKSTLAVGYFNALSFQQVVNPLLEFLRQRCPSLKIDVFATDVGDARVRFMEDKLDLLVTAMIDENEWSDVSYYSLISTPLKIIISSSHPWYQKESVTEEDIAHSTLLFYEEGSPAFMKDMIVRERVSMRNYDSYIGRLSNGEEFGVVANIYSRREGNFKLLPLPEKLQCNIKIIAAFKKENPQKTLFNEMENLHL